MRKIDSILRRLRRKPVELERLLGEVVSNSKKDAEKAQALVALARLANARGEGAKALGLLGRALKLDPSRRDELGVDYGMAYRASDSPTQALPYFRRAVLRDAQNATAVVGLASLLPKDRERWMLKVVGVRTAPAAPHVEIGLWLMHRGDVAGAKKHFMAALRDPGFVAGSVERLARAGAAACGDEDQVRRLLKLPMGTLEPQVLDLLLPVLRKKNIPRRDLLAASVARWPERTDLRLELAQVSEPDQAERELRAVIAYEEDASRRRYAIAQLAELLARRDRLAPDSDVAAAIRQIPTEQITDAVTLRHLGEAFSDLRDYHRARACLTRAASDAEGGVRLVGLLLREGDYDGALAASQNLLEHVTKGPAAAKLRAAISLCQAVRGDARSARRNECFARPASEFTLLCLASAALAAGEHRRALAYSRRLGAFVDGLELQAQATYRCGDLRRARALFEKALALRPEHKRRERALTLAGLACCLARSGDSEGAREAVLKAQQAYPEMSGDDLRAAVLEAAYYLGTRSQALAAMDEIIATARYPHRFIVRRNEWLKAASRVELKVAS